MDKEFNEGKKYFKEYAPELEKDIEEVVDEIEDDTPDYRENWKQSTDIYSFWKNFKWTLNLIFVGGSYLFSELCMLGINFFLNLDYNTFWAGGNLFLIFNTYYLVV